jgi:hypothetical protein
MCLFLALWMELFALVTTCAAITRTISFCLDAMSGGLVRLYILGKITNFRSFNYPQITIVLIKVGIRQLMNHGRTCLA